MSISVYLSGEIHSDWRTEIKNAISIAGLDIEVLEPVTDHSASDDVGEAILGQEDRSFWRDHKGAKINAIRIRAFIEQADVVVVKFGDQYRQWNAAFDAGYAVALGKPLITLHDSSLTHALKEIDGAAQATAESPQQVAEILKYCFG